jgi:hypothetical protein
MEIGRMEDEGLDGRWDEAGTQTDTELQMVQTFCLKVKRIPYYWSPVTV